MGYPSPLVAAHRKLTENVLTTSTPFSIMNRVNIGARMTIFNYEGGVVIWSGIPYCDVVKEALEKIGNSNVTWLIVPNVQHTMAVKSCKEKFPNLKILAMGNAEKNQADYVFTSAEHGETLIDRPVLEKMGITDPTILNHFEFVYLNNHKNKEIVLYDKTSKILCEADVLFNMEPELEQYSPATGYPEGFYPFSGWSFLGRYLQPYSIIGNYIVRERLNNGAMSAKGLQQVLNWDFETIVPCHGNTIEIDAKKAFKNLFSPVLDVKL
ncbi:uncharacterized protein KQ657_003425 [Scheffersomyces spartinae]|uniref:Uncharacterized protein n=1 Tax=Scheffersomyces spartinae TaxID=45513 RepID=A0A9P7VCP9_9ASCO|nr:uncharacterized protein KQ657_003425 [Scheffersomyces spartinae]KAG7195655.1 hypothetical protein KQ657_003425 [Scheffersomyces spartinae]